MATVTVDIDPSEVIDEIDTDDLIDELKARAKRGRDALASSYVSQLGSANDEDRIREMVDAGAAQELLCFMSRLLEPKVGERLAAAYAKLPRDPATGRPVIQ